MELFLRQSFQPDPLAGILTMLIAFVLYVLLGLLPILGATYLLYFLVTLPMRRNERARMFLDLMELGLKDQRSPEAALVDASSSHDVSLGARFHLLAAYLEQGMPLSQGLERVPRLLPPQTIAMLKAGERTGDLAKVLPACRLHLRDSVSNVRGALNYLILLSFVATPFAIFVPVVLKVSVLPKFKEVFAGLLEGAQLPPFTRLVFDTNSLMITIQVLILVLVWLLALAYLGGPRLRRWLQRVLPGKGGWIDWLVWQLPWRRKRLRRDFSAVLAVLLEADVPETEAVRLAGESTANARMIHRAETAQSLITQGMKLPEAIRVMDESGELHWRLTNAFQRRGGFVRALAGWHEALDAKAFQLEQTAAQTATTFLVLLNGLLIGSVVIGIFLALIQVINAGTLW